MRSSDGGMKQKLDDLVAEMIREDLKVAARSVPPATSQLGESAVNEIIYPLKGKRIWVAGHKEW